MRSVFLSLILSSLIASSCKTTEPMLVDHSERIVLGSFGGFAGSFEEHTITPDGSTYSQLRHQGEILSGQKIDQSIVDQAMSVLKQLQKEDYKISDSGNMTYFLRLYKDGEQTIEWVWGGRNDVPDQRLKIMYKTLSKFCDGSSSAPKR